MSKFPNQLSTGHKVEQLSDEDNGRICRHFPNYGNIIRLNPGGWFFEECMPPILERIYKFEFKSSDIITMTFPKSGTTWSQEILWTFLNNPNLDNPLATQMLDFRSPHIDGDLFLKMKGAIKPSPETMKMVANFFQQVAPHRVNDEHLMFTVTECIKSPRVIKTHLPFSLLPPSLLQNSKVLYVARDPRDVIVSRFSFVQLLKVHSFKASFDDFLDYFFREEMLYNPYWEHLKEAWDLRDHPNVLFLFFEDMKANPLKEYQKINKFLGTNLTSQQIEKIVEYTSFTQMKKMAQVQQGDAPMSAGGVMFNKEVEQKTGGFFRQGKAGDWTDKYTPEQQEKLNKWIQNATKGFPSNFPYINKQ